jgi:hypothetical protein
MTLQKTARGESIRTRSVKARSQFQSRRLSRTRVARAHGGSVPQAPRPTKHWTPGSKRAFELTSTGVEADFWESSRWLIPFQKRPSDGCPEDRTKKVREIGPSDQCRWKFPGIS